MTDEIPIQFGEGNPNCLHCHLAYAIGRVVTVCNELGTTIEPALLIGSLVKVLSDTLKQIPGRDLLVAACLAEVLTCGVEEMPNKETMN